MEARELRIGNFIYEPDGETIVRVYQLEHRYKNVYRLNDVDFEEEKCDRNPIPLTPEILEKCAIVVLGSKWLLTEDKDSHYIWRNDNGKIFYVIDDFGHDGRSEVEIKYLHQLQNLYFALTGEELKIEL